METTMRRSPDDSNADPTASGSDAPDRSPLEPEIERFDHVLVGTGQATATLISGLPDDETVCVIEGDRVGGTCVNDGCTPTKTLVASAKVAHQARRGAEYGVRTGEVGIDFAAVMARMNEVRGGSREGLTSFLENNERVTLIRGWAAFEEPGVLRVGDRRVAGANTYLNVGARARVPTVPGLDGVPWLDNTSLLELDELPRHLIIVGGSYVGLEMAQVFRRLGSEVTVLEAGPQLMTREDADIAETARGIFEAEGIDIVTQARMTRVDRGGDGDGVEVVADVDGTSRTVRGSHLLLAVGRVPNSDRLNLEAAGIEPDDGGRRLGAGRRQRSGRLHAHLGERRGDRAGRPARRPQAPQRARHDLRDVRRSAAGPRGHVREGSEGEGPPGAEGDEADEPHRQGEGGRRDRGHDQAPRRRRHRPVPGRRGAGDARRRAGQSVRGVDADRRGLAHVPADGVHPPDRRRAAPLDPGRARAGLSVAWRAAARGAARRPRPPRCRRQAAAIL